MIVLVTGGRHYSDAAHVWAELDRIHVRTPGLCIVQGGAKGADAHARRWCAARGVPCLTMDAHWDVYGNAAGNLRNGWMLEYLKVDLCLAFPGGPGTTDMKSRAHRRGVPVYEA